MKVSDNKRYLEFHLKNGWRYEERGNYGDRNTEYIRLGFKEYKKSFDLSSFGFQGKSADSLNRNNAKMFSMRQLNVAIDSLTRAKANFSTKVRSDVLTSVPFIGYMDTTWKSKEYKFGSKASFDTFIPDSVKGFIQPRLSSKIGTMKANNEVIVLQYSDYLRNLRSHQIEWHRKITLSLACLVLFLIGAPLGAIIRKGGLGSPLIFAIVFFMVFYFTSTTGEKFGREGSWSPVVGMWFSTMVLVPIGVFLTYKALHDSQLFNKDYYKRLLSKLPIKRQKKGLA
jgi:lipopolysaccharide export system permease protein